MNNIIDFITMYIIPIIYCVILLSFGETRQCRRGSSNGLQYFCCFNYEPTTDGCQECQPGYNSFNGNNCEPCKKNYYGIRCLNMCSCSDNRIHYRKTCTSKKSCYPCDNVKGCVTNSQIFETTESGTTSVSKSLQNTFKDGVANIELLIYIAISGLSAVSIGLCVIYRKRAIKMPYSCKIRRNVSPCRSMELRSTDERNEQNMDSLYDIIDESNMHNYEDQDGENEKKFYGDHS